MMAPMFFRAARAVLALVAVTALAGGCSPTEGEPTRFKPVPTTNVDFQAPLYLGAGDYPLALDVLTDGSGVLQRVVVSNRYSHDLSVAAWDGTALSLQATLPLPTGATQPSTVLWADLDGDGNRGDIAVLHSANRELSLYLESAGGGAWSRVATLGLPDVASRMERLQANGTAADELVLVVPNANRLIVVVNSDADTAGSYTASRVETTTDGVATLPGRFAVADFDNDGTPDIALIHPALNLLTLWLGDGAGGFTHAVTAGTNDDPKYLVTGEFDGTAGVDVAVSTATDSVVNVYRGNNLGGLARVMDIAVPAVGDRLLAGDLVTNDATEELAVMIPGADLFSLIHDPATSVGRSDIGTNEQPQDGVIGDFSGGTDPDLVLLETEDRALSVYTGNGTGYFTHTAIGFTTLPTFLTKVDADGSAKDDLLLLQPNQDRLVLLLNRN